ncbi:hypothetical protein B0H13DRAFT_2236648 [Mycena leptocephala]|nr:hypothetical protein B0H13DRAFT_2236648 [Mycena leptocephala]
MSFVVPEAHQQFQHILRLLNMNVNRKRKIMYTLTEIKGVGRRYSNLVCKKADIDLNKCAGDLNSDELECIQILSNSVDLKLCDDLERLKKIRAHCGHQGKTVGLSKKHG